jgi:glycosyltransferase 2 family protein
VTPHTRKLLSRAVPIVFYAALIVFLGFYISGIDWSSLADISINWWLAVSATVVSLSFRYWGVMIWFFLLGRLGATGLAGKYTSLTQIYAKSWLGRYIPGAATWIVGKVYFASKHGISRGRLAVSGLLEGGLQIVTTLAVALLLLLIDPRTIAAVGTWGVVAMVGAFLVCVLALVPRIFEALVNLALRILRRPKLDRELLPTTATILLSSLLYLGGALLAGFSYYLISASIYPGIKPTDIAFIVGVTSLASAASMLAIFAPGGVGVREGIMLVLLAIVMPHAVVVVLVVLTRVWSIAVDGLFFGVTTVTNAIVNRRSTSE